MRGQGRSCLVHKRREHSCPAQKRKMKKDSKRGSVCCKDDDLRDTSVQSLCSLVGSLFQLPGMACLLHNVQQLLGQSRIGDGPSCRSVLFFCHFEVELVRGGMLYEEACGWAGAWRL